MNHSRLKVLDGLAYGMAALFALDRLLKLAAVMHFFRRPSPPRPLSWPTVTLLQSITRGASGLQASLHARGQLDYAVEVQHLLICDAHDEESQAVCRAFLNDFPALQAEIVLVKSDPPGVASKIRKLQVALPRAKCEVLCLIDDDVAPRPGTLQMLIPYLFRPGVGAVFVLPCFINWRTLWSTLLSGFVNANVLLSYIALTYLTDPFRITGHIVAFRRETLMQVGWLDGLEDRIDDDYEFARRLRIHSLRSVQSPLICDIDNELGSLKAYVIHLRRWFVIGRRAMMPSLTTWQRTVAFLTSSGLLLPSLIGVHALLTRRPAALFALGTSLGTIGAVYALCEVRYLKRHMPLRGWPLLLIATLLTPIQIVASLLSNNEVEWRGQRLRIHQDGKVEVIA